MWKFEINQNREFPFLNRFPDYMLGEKGWKMFIFSCCIEWWFWNLHRYSSVVKMKFQTSKKYWNREFPFFLEKMEFLIWLFPPFSESYAWPNSINHFYSSNVSIIYVLMYIGGYSQRQLYEILKNIDQEFPRFLKMNSFYNNWFDKKLLNFFGNTFGF